MLYRPEAQALKRSRKLTMGTISILFVLKVIVILIDTKGNPHHDGLPFTVLYMPHSD